MLESNDTVGSSVTTLSINLIGKLSSKNSYFKTEKVFSLRDLACFFSSKTDCSSVAAAITFAFLKQSALVYAIKLPLANGSKTTSPACGSDKKFTTVSFDSSKKLAEVYLEFFAKVFELSVKTVVVVAPKSHDIVRFIQGKYDIENQVNLKKSFVYKLKIRG